MPATLKKTVIKEQMPWIRRVMKGRALHFGFQAPSGMKGKFHVSKRPGEVKPNKIKELEQYGPKDDQKKKDVEDAKKKNSLPGGASMGVAKGENGILTLYVTKGSKQAAAKFVKRFIAREMQYKLVKKVKVLENATPPDVPEKSDLDDFVPTADTIRQRATELAKRLKAINGAPKDLGESIKSAIAASAQDPTTADDMLDEVEFAIMTWERLVSLENQLSELEGSDNVDADAVKKIGTDNLTPARQHLTSGSVDDADDCMEEAEEAITGLTTGSGTQASESESSDDDSQALTEFQTRHQTLQKLVVKIAKEHPNALSDADKQKIGAVLKKAQEFAGKQDFSNAGKAHDGVQEILTTALKSEQSGASDQLANQWKSALETITPSLKQALVDDVGDTQKMKMVLAYAKEKADAGEYTSAIKSLGALEMLINEAKAISSDPLTPWKETAKNAVFQINRLQFALRSYEKQLSKELKGAPEEEAKKMQVAMTGSLKIAEMLEEVVGELNSLPASEQDVKKLSDYMKSDIVAAAEKPNPFNLKVDITGPVSRALTELQTHFSDN